MYCYYMYYAIHALLNVNSIYMYILLMHFKHVPLCNYYIQTTEYIYIGKILLAFYVYTKYSLSL